MPKLSPTDQRQKVRIGTYDLIEAAGYDKDMKPLANISDTGFNTTASVIKRMKKEVFPGKLSYVCIANDSKEWCYMFDSTGKRFDMTDRTIK